MRAQQERGQLNPAPSNNNVEELSGFIFQNIFGCLGGLIWCYIVIVQFDPNSTCPADGCWIVVLALAVWTLLGTVAMPWLSVMTIRTLRSSPSETFAYESIDKEEEDEDEDYYYYYYEGEEESTGCCKRGSCERFGGVAHRWCVACWRCLRAVLQHWGLETEVVRRCRELLCRSSGTAWSVGLYTTIHECVRMLEFETMKVSAGNSSNDDSFGSFGSAAKGVLLLASFVFVVALVVTSLAILAMGSASRVLSRGNNSPLVVEMLLMLRSNLYYSVAYTWATFLGLLWFAPYELAPVAESNVLTSSDAWSDNVDAAFAVMRAVTLIVLFTRVALTSLGRPPSEDDVESTASAPWLTCAKLLVFKASAVTVAIAANDAAQGFISAAHARGAGLSMIPPISTNRDFSLSLTVAGFIYAGFLLAAGGVVYTVLLRRRRRRRPDASCDDEDDEPTPRFVRLVFNWLVIFATWTPWWRLLKFIYSTVANAVGHVALLPIQIAIALLMTVALAFCSAVLHKALLFFSSSTSGDFTFPASSSADDDDDGNYSSTNPFLDGSDGGGDQSHHHEVF